ncbi:hypothetical protein VYU27_006189 [Nannochloropsis oceanica]
MSRHTAASRALQHYTSMAQTEDKENAGQVAWLREENDYYDDEDEQPRSLFCGGGMGALCAAIHHLHPHEAATPAAAKKKEYMQQQHVSNEEGIPSSEILEHATALDEVIVKEQEEEGEEEIAVEIDMHASAARQQLQPISRSWLQGHDDVYTAAGDNCRRTRSFSSSFLLPPSLPTTTLLTEMRATLRGTRPAPPPPPSPPSPPSPAARAASSTAGTALGKINSILHLPPTRQQHQQPNPKQGQRLRAIPASQKFVLCMSCSNEEWLQVPQTAKYVRCPICTSITIALTSNTRFPVREERRTGGGPCTRLMTFFSMLQGGGGGPASL